MLERIKQALRISNDSLDEDIAENIAAGVDDLRRRGVEAAVTSTEKLVIRAVELYCKWNYDYLGKGDAWYTHYEALATAMALAQEDASDKYWEDVNNGNE